MRATWIARVAALVVLLGAAETVCLAETIVNADFSKGGFAVSSWRADGDWDVFPYPKEAANSPGAVARFAANKPDASLTKTFA